MRVKTAEKIRPFSDSAALIREDPDFPRMIVLDASVAAKTYLEEAGAEAATELLAGPVKLLAPELIRLEVAGPYAAYLCR